VLAALCWVEGMEPNSSQMTTLQTHEHEFSP